MLAAVEDHMLPDLVADRNCVELPAEAGEQFEVFAWVNHGGRIERIVEQHRLGLAIECAFQHLLGKPPMRRLQSQEPRDAAGLTDDWKIGIIDRLENDHFVAGFDNGEDGAGQGLRAARSHHHLAHRVQLEPVPAPVMGRDRLAQFGNAHHRRVLVIAIHGSIGCRLPDVLGAGMVGKALAEIDGVIVARKLRHRLEDRDGEVSKDLVHGPHGKASAAGPGRQSSSLPAQNATGEMLVVGKARGLRRQRGGYRTFSRSAGKDHLLALRVGNASRIEG